MRKHARVDTNQTKIVRTARQLGASVAHTHQLGDGFPDLVLGWRGRNLLVEVKDGDKPPSERKLTPDEEAWHDRWRGSVHVVTSADDLIDLLNRTS